MTNTTEAIETMIAPDGEAAIIDTDYELGQDNIEAKIWGLKIDLHNPVFLLSSIAIITLVAFTLLAPEGSKTFFEWLRPTITSTFDWFFLFSANIFLVVCIVLIFTPLAKVRIGGTEAKAEHSYPSWLAMLFAAGMGIGLMFYGVSEPISHYSSSIAENAGNAVSWAPLAGASGNVEASQDLAMAATIFHWGLHPWAIYAIVALGLALFCYNKSLPLSFRSIFYPIFGERVWGWTGHVIDVLAVFATLFGLATSLGLGASQATAGLNFLFDLPNSNIAQVVLIVVITLCAIISVVLGVNAGVKRLSEANMILAILLLGFVIVVGPTMAILKGYFSNLAHYFEYLPALSNPFSRDDANFSQGWTSFYWAWWISWSPFVGMFIARISRGRTVREFLTCVLLIPSAVSVLWMTAFGGTAINLVAGGANEIASAALELKLFVMLTELPLANITSFIAIILVLVFFVTSSDSGSLVIDTITAGGKMEAPVGQRIFWASAEGIVAIVLLLGGGLGALQAAAVSTGLPFTLVLLVGTYCVIKGLMDEPTA